ncbi:MAG: cobalamin-dependent protein [Chloroflexota bacterium]
MDGRGSQFNPYKYPDMPMYNIQAVAAATGVPSITLRSWERRYGIPEPKRDAKGYRLYSERDIAVTRWLKERVQHGIGISRAINMYRVLEQESAAVEPVKTLDFSSLQERLVEAIRHMDEAGVNHVLSEALMVATVEEVSLKLLQPCLYTVGHMWSGGDLSVTSEHFGSNLVRSHLAQMVRITPPPLRDSQILVGCAPGEMHDIGPLMLALFLRRRGFGVIYVGANVEARSLIYDVGTLQPVAVCLSASTPSTAQAIATIFTELKTMYSGLLAYGGRVFNERVELRDQVPGIYLGADAATATLTLEANLPDSSLALT